MTEYGKSWYSRNQVVSDSTFERWNLRTTYTSEEKITFWSAFFSYLQLRSTLPLLIFFHFFFDIDPGLLLISPHYTPQIHVSCPFPYDYSETQSLLLCIHKFFFPCRPVPKSARFLVSVVFLPSLQHHLFFFCQQHVCHFPRHIC